MSEGPTVADILKQQIGRAEVKLSNARREQMKFQKIVDEAIHEIETFNYAIEVLERKDKGDKK